MKKMDGIFPDERTVVMRMREWKVENPRNKLDWENSSTCFFFQDFQLSQLQVMKQESFS